MKMEGYGKSTNTSNAAASNGGNKENVFSGIYESAHFANILIEFENDNREMAVDVPDSFVAQTKTPPKYPPPNPNQSMMMELHEGRSSGGSSFSLSNGTGTGSGRISGGKTSPPPPDLIARDHLKIEKDGRLIVTSEDPPEVPPTAQQSQRIKKYEAEMAKRAAETEKKSQQDEFLRHSIRNSQKMRALKEGSRLNNSGMNNEAFHQLQEDPCRSNNEGLQNVTPTDLIGALERLASASSNHPIGVGYKKDFAQIRRLFNDARFQQSFLLAQQVESGLDSKYCVSSPLSLDSQDVAEESLSCLSSFEGVPEAHELSRLLAKPSMCGLLFAHDQVSSLRQLSSLASTEEDVLLERLSHYSEPNIKIVRIEKTSEPLGATVKNDGEAVIVGRIIRGGTAEASGLLHEGDEILEVNEVELRGKDVNEVCDILARMTGTLTFLVVPTRHHMSSMNMSTSSSVVDGGRSPGVVHVKAHIDYDPEDDPYVPCRELGISFQKGDILHVINQRDPHWWQARRDGEEDQTLAGLIPSAQFQAQREAMKHTIAQDADKYDVKNGFGGSHGRRSGFLCAKRSGRNKKRKRVPYMPDEEGVESEEIVTYEEVALYYPRADRKRPVVLIGPPNIGRHELRQRLMLDTERFAAAIPHTSRPKRADEVDGQDYHFISRLQFEQDILARRFVEHGEYEKSYYGTSLEAIRSVVFSEKICVLNLHPQSLKILKSSDLMPYVVFVAPPSLEKLKRWKIDHSEPINDDELRDIIERAREMEETYGHYFDMIIIYSDPERAHQQLLSSINSLEREPQWVPGAWLANNAKADTM